MLWGLVFPSGIAHSFLTQLTVPALEASFNCASSRAMVSLESFPFPLPCLPLLWALSLFSFPMPVMSNFANFSHVIFLVHIQNVTSPFPLPHGNSMLARGTVTIITVFWSPVGKMGSLHVRTRAQSIIMQVSAGAILFQFASLQGPRICSLIILNEVASQLESAFFKILLCLMILFVNFK